MPRGAKVTIGQHTSTEPPTTFSLHLSKDLYSYPGLKIVVKALRFLVNDQQLAQDAAQGMLEGGTHFNMIELTSQMLPVHNTPPSVHHIHVNKCGTLTHKTAHPQDVESRGTSVQVQIVIRS